MSAANLNWALALPEIVLACCGMAILVIGVLRKTDATQICSMLTLGAFLVAAMLVRWWRRILARPAPTRFRRALAAMLARLSVFAAQSGPAVQSIDLNPVFAMPEGQGAFAADAVIEIGS